MKILETQRRLDATPVTQLTATAMPPVTLLTDSSAILPGRPLFIPEFSQGWQIYLCPAVRVSRLGKFIGRRFARRYYDAYTVVARLRPTDAGCDGACAEAFDNAITLGRWVELGDGEELTELTVTRVGDLQVTLDDAALDIDGTVSRLSEFFTLKTGDIVIPGHVAEPWTPVIDTHLCVDAGAHRVMDFNIK